MENTSFFSWLRNRQLHWKRDRGSCSQNVPWVRLGWNIQENSPKKFKKTCLGQWTWSWQIFGLFFFGWRNLHGKPGWTSIHGNESICIQCLCYRGSGNPYPSFSKQCRVKCQLMTRQGPIICICWGEMENTPTSWHNIQWLCDFVWICSFHKPCNSGSRIYSCLWREPY